MSVMTNQRLSTADYIRIEEELGAHNYHPLDLVIEEAEGVWVFDVEGKKYLDCLSAYSALNQGHRHPAIIHALVEQAGRVTLTSRAFRNGLLPLLYQDLVRISGLPRVLPMNTGTEAVETALKAARLWGHRIKGIPENQAEIIVCQNNFHGRSTTVVSFSTEPLYKTGFGPFTPGFKVIPFGDLEALKQAITPNTCAFLVEPIQGEAGVIVPPTGFLKSAEALCREHNVLLMLDEIQTGLGRTGKMFAFEHEGVSPDVVVIGKALSGGVMPVSAMLASHEVMDTFTPGSHGSTFGGNPLGCAVARAALRVIEEEKLSQRAAELGQYLMDQVRTLHSPHIREVRGKGLLVGIELNKPARPFCEALMERGILCKETHSTVIRIAPPLVIEKKDLDWLVGQLKAVLS